MSKNHRSDFRFLVTFEFRFSRNLPRYPGSTFYSIAELLGTSLHISIQLVPKFSLVPSFTSSAEFSAYLNYHILFISSYPLTAKKFHHSPLSHDISPLKVWNSVWIRWRWEDFFYLCNDRGISLQCDRTSSREAIRQQIGMAICIGFIRVDVSCCSHRQTQSLRLSLQLNFQLISLYIAASGEREYHKRCKLHIKFVHFLPILQKFSLNISKFYVFLSLVSRAISFMGTLEHDKLLTHFAGG